MLCKASTSQGLLPQSRWVCMVLLMVYKCVYMGVGIGIPNTSFLLVIGSTYLRFDFIVLNECGRGIGTYEPKAYIPI